MTSSPVTQFLNEKFVSFQDLAQSLDSINSSLKASSDALNLGLIEKREARTAAQNSAVSTLRAMFIAWMASPTSTFSASKLDILDSDFNSALTDLYTQFPNIRNDYTIFDSIIYPKFAQIKALITSLHCLTIAQKVRDAANTVASLTLEKDFDKALDLLDSIEQQYEPSLRIYASPTQTKDSALGQIAIQTLRHLHKNVRTPLQDHMNKRLKVFFEKAKWPVSTVAPALYDEFINLFVKYLETEASNPDQLAGLLATPQKASKYPIPLSAFAALVAPIDLRFQFHFEAKSDTNRPDKPEWAYHHFLNVIEGHIDFLIHAADAALQKSSRFNDRNGVHEFITALLPSVRRKALSLFSQVTSSPKLLSHLVYETIMFDNAIREKYYYVPYNSDPQSPLEWRGISGDILSNDDAYNTWLKIELASAKDRFAEIIESQNAWQIDYDFVSHSETKPTESAINLKDLIEGITEHYSSLTSIRFRMKYFVTIQIDLLDKYYERLNESMTAFESLTSRFSRAVGSVSAEDKQSVSGIRGLERLCRIFGSLNYIVKALEEWGEEKFFLKMWDDLNKRTSQLQADPNRLANETLFDETIQSYNKLISRVEIAMVSLLKTEFNGSMREYFKKNNWATMTIEQDPVEVSRGLIPAIRTISSLLSFLYRFFSPFHYTRVVRRFAQDIEHYIFNFIISANQFSYDGGRQLQADIAELWAAFRLPSEASLRRLDQCATILALPAAGQVEPNLASIKSIIHGDDNGYEEVRADLQLTNLSDMDIEKLLNRRIAGS
ncbi:uncharacterized protein SAPINGB_P000230 [Magnusiomyces paraingens]|uniref:Uncharacterized protein n=1 Tax=Magnusiomyces paraingens TaxID=2606893 RepID=A0A5E8AYA7_9ASCO|nr:uncharacterized protein SAPINGB_P000230 [Saprochaete ingens]VVT43956.1 unnamed protein product [Saprochaete ingens]